MGIVLDYTAQIAPDALKAAGVVGVCRYLSWPYWWGGQTHTYINPKIIQKPEFDELRADGITVTLNWEFDSQDWMSGAAGGVAHATEAVRQARALGYPDGCVIVGSADFNMSRTDWDSAGHGYAQAFAAAIRAGGFRPGVYGPWDVLTWCRDEAGYDAFWQAGMSTSWSNWRNANAWPGAHLRQRGYKTVAGQQCDWNEILIPDWGDDMEQSDQVKGSFSRGNTVGDVFADLSNNRDYWYVPPGTKTNNPPPAGSRADLLMQAAQKVLAAAPATFTDEQAAAMAAQIGAVLVARPDNPLGKADEPAIVDAVKQALREGAGA